MTTLALIANARRVRSLMLRIAGCKTQKELDRLLDECGTIEEVGHWMTMSACVARAAKEKRSKNK